MAVLNGGQHKIPDIVEPRTIDMAELTFPSSMVPTLPPPPPPPEARRARPSLWNLSFLVSLQLCKVGYTTNRYMCVTAAGATVETNSVFNACRRAFAVRALVTPPGP